MDAVDLPAPRGTIRLSVHERFEDVRTAWERLQAECDGYVYQSIEFVEPWARHVAPTQNLSPRIFLAEREGKPVAIVPLALGRLGGVPMLLPCSDTHTNANGGLFASDWDVEAAVLQTALLDLVPQAEGMLLDNLPVATDHPLLAEPRPSVHEIHGGSLQDGFDGHLSRISGRRRRKKHRKSARRFDGAGGWTAGRVEDADEAVRLLDEARGLFAARFAQEGIADPFAGNELRAFMVEALRNSIADARPCMAIWTLSAGGNVLAIQGGGGTGDCFSLMFTTYRPSPLDGAAPGDFLLHEVIAWAAENGYARFDLGRGREPYKTSWCDEVVPLHDVAVARTLRAKLLLSALGTVAALKKRVRDDDRLWAAAKTVRRGLSRAA